MATTEELRAQEAALEQMLAAGVRSVTHGTTNIQYQTAADIKAALFEVRRQLRSAPISEVRFSTSKGR